jgi:hypothetical protein
MTQLDAFDLPQLGPNCIERRQSTVPTQALQMMNGETLRELSRYMAARLIDQYAEDARQQIEQAYWRSYSRRPTDSEFLTAFKALTKLKDQWLSHLEQEKPETPELYTARWRALADLCRTLLSSAEFLYVD